VQSTEFLGFGCFIAINIYIKKGTCNKECESCCIMFAIPVMEYINYNICLPLKQIYPFNLLHTITAIIWKQMLPIAKYIVTLVHIKMIDNLQERKRKRKEKNFSVKFCILWTIECQFMFCVYIWRTNAFDIVCISINIYRHRFYC